MGGTIKRLNGCHGQVEFSLCARRAAEKSNVSGILTGCTGPTDRLCERRTQSSVAASCHRHAALRTLARLISHHIRMHRTHVNVVVLLDNNWRARCDRINRGDRQFAQRRRQLNRLRVIEVSNGFHARALRQRHYVLELINRLPVVTIILATPTLRAYRQAAAPLLQATLQTERGGRIAIRCNCRRIV